jgi:hypothetical protein
LSSLVHSGHHACLSKCYNVTVPSFGDRLEQ